jgi:hypothetical protein
MASESSQIDIATPQAGKADQNASPAEDSAKRKAEQSNGTHTRTKRNRYISIAWYDPSGAKLRIYPLFASVNCCKFMILIVILVIQPWD